VRPRADAFKRRVVVGNGAARFPTLHDSALFATAVRRGARN
jgi:hypothetical protein